MRIDELIAQRIEARLEAKLANLDSVLDSILEKAIESALARVLGVEVEAPKRTRTRTRKAKAEAEVEVAAPTAAAAAPKAEVVEPTAAAAPKAEVEPAPKAEVELAPKAEVEAEALLTRLERAAARLGEHYGPMLLRRARSISRHAINPKGALAVLVAWAEGAPAEEVVAALRGSEKLSDGTTLSGWKLLCARLGIPVK